MQNNINLKFQDHNFLIKRANEEINEEREREKKFLKSHKIYRI